MDRADRQAFVLLGRQRGGGLDARLLEKAHERCVAPVTLLVRVRRATQRSQVLLDARAVRGDRDVVGVLQQVVVAVDRSVGDRERGDHGLGELSGAPVLAAHATQLLAEQRKRRPRYRARGEPVLDCPPVTGCRARLEQIDPGSCVRTG